MQESRQLRTAPFGEPDGRRGSVPGIAFERSSQRCRIASRGAGCTTVFFHGFTLPAISSSSINPRIHQLAKSFQFCLTTQLLSSISSATLAVESLVFLKEVTARKFRGTGEYWFSEPLAERKLIQSLCRNGVSLQRSDRIGCVLSASCIHKNSPRGGRAVLRFSGNW